MRFMHRKTRHVLQYSIDLRIMLAFTQLPFNLPGNVYRSAMPYGSYDPDGALFDKYKAEHVTTVVALAEEGEIVRLSGRNLIALYQKQGWRVIYMPVIDFATPEMGVLRESVSKALQAASAGERVAIHCSAGIGRTGLFVACMAKQALGMTGEQAIDWVRRYIPHAVETEAQKKLVIDY